MFFNSVVQNNTQITQDFSESLVNIVGPIRQAIHLKCQSTDAGFKFYKAVKMSQCQSSITLVNFILEGIDLSENGFSKESLALDQIMMFNFRFNRYEKGNR